MTDFSDEADKGVTETPHQQQPYILKDGREAKHHKYGGQHQLGMA